MNSSGLLKKKRRKTDANSAVTVKPLDLDGLEIVNHALLKISNVFGLFNEVPSLMKDDSDGSTNDTTASSSKSDADILVEVMKLVSKQIIAKD